MARSRKPTSTTPNAVPEPEPLPTTDPESADRPAPSRGGRTAEWSGQGERSDDGGRTAAVSVAARPTGRGGRYAQAHAWIDDEDEDEDDEIGDGDEIDEDDDDDEGDKIDEESVIPAPPAITVLNTDRQLEAFLESVIADPIAGAQVLADWLEERADPRAEALRDLTAVQCVVPEGALHRYRHLGFPMGCGRWWSATRQYASVTACAYPGTPLANTIRAFGCGVQTTVRIRHDLQTPETLRQAFERCRLNLILGLFGTSIRQRRDRQTVLADSRIDRVLKALQNWPTTVAAPWLCEAQAADAERFEAIMNRIWSQPNLRDLGYQVMDTLQPGWQQDLTSALGRGS